MLQRVAKFAYSPEEFRRFLCPDPGMGGRKTHPRGGIACGMLPQAPRIPREYQMGDLLWAKV